MADIHGYLSWRGDITLAERPFNDADNVILACLSYFDFTGIVPTEKAGGSISISQACDHLITKSAGCIKQFVRSFAQLDASFLKALAKSARFGEARLSNYIDIVDEERSLQFSALQIDLPSKETYVSYRGTDNTIVGWREDFMLSFQVTEAQREATAYLNRAITRANALGNSVLVGGHSKGGILAEYAAVNCDEELRKSITKVFSNDGPNMAPELIKHNPHTVLGDRLQCIVPTYSVVGMLFAQDDDPRTVVVSKGVGIGQHDPSTWQLTFHGIKTAPDLSEDCKVVNSAIAKWAQEIPLDERARVVDVLFDALGAGGAKSINEIGDSVEGFQKVLSALKATDPQTRELASALVETTVDSSVTAIRQATKSAFDQWKKGLFESAEEAARKLLGEG